MKNLLIGLLILGSISSFACMEVICSATSRFENNIDFYIEVKPLSDELCLIKITEHKEHWWRGWRETGSRTIRGSGSLKDGRIKLYFNEDIVDQKYVLESFSGRDLPYGPDERTAGIFGRLIYTKNGEQQSARYACLEYR